MSLQGLVFVLLKSSIGMPWATRSLGTSIGEQTDSIHLFRCLPGWAYPYQDEMRGSGKGTLVNVIALSVNPRGLCTCGRFLRDKTYTIHRCVLVVMAKKPQITAIYNNYNINIIPELHAHVNDASIL